MRRLLILALALAGAGAALAQGRDERRSGFDFMGPDTKAMQQDDAANPGMLAVLEGEGLWNAVPEGGGKACTACHGDAAETMRGVAARFPRVSAAEGRAVTLDDQIRRCRAEHQKAPAPGFESRELLALSTYVALQSRGMAIEKPAPDMARVVAAGRALYEQRMGQLNLACKHCHDDHAGGRLGAAPIPQAHPTGYPLYRLEWQAVGSLQRRMRGCLTGVRAEPFAYGAAEMTALEAFLKDRAAGMPMEAPAVRP